MRAMARRLAVCAAPMAALIACVSIVGCRNELLSPSECEYLAQRIAKVTSPEQLRNPRLRREVSDQTNRCLVAPYDKTFLRCLGEVGRVDVCEANLMRRQGRPKDRAPRR